MLVTKAALSTVRANFSFLTLRAAAPRFLVRGDRFRKEKFAGGLVQILDIHIAAEARMNKIHSILHVRFRSHIVESYR